MPGDLAQMTREVLEMAFGLSFSEEFFTGGMDADPDPDRPWSIYQAAESLTLDERRQLALDLALWRYPANRRGYDSKIWPTCECFASDIVELAREVDTCSDLRSPVEVWLDPDGWTTLSVYDKPCPECGGVTDDQCWECMGSGVAS